jgi:hypothetical protein
MYYETRSEVILVEESSNNKDYVSKKMPRDVPLQYGSIAASILQGFKLFRAFKILKMDLMKKLNFTNCINYVTIVSLEL